MEINKNNQGLLQNLQNEYGEKEGQLLFDRLEQQYYEPSQSEEFYDPENDEYFNISGQKLRNPDEYDESFEDSTPFGDE
jgi:hypothetical protein